MSVSRVLINGGGLSGLTAGVSLARQGVAVKIFERLAQPRNKAAVILFPQSQAVLHELGLGSKLEALANPLSTLEVQNVHTEILDTVDLSKLQSTHSHTPIVVKHRELCEMLAQAARESGVEIETGREVTKFVDVPSDSTSSSTESVRVETRDTKVSTRETDSTPPEFTQKQKLEKESRKNPRSSYVILDEMYHKEERKENARKAAEKAKRNGTTLETPEVESKIPVETDVNVREDIGSVLIGADGLDSTVRTQLFGPAGVRYTGRTMVYGENPVEDLGMVYQDVSVLVQRLGKKKLFGHCVTQDKKAIWWMVYDCPKAAGAEFGLAEPSNGQGLLQQTLSLSFTPKSQRLEDWRPVTDESDMWRIKDSMYDVGIGHRHGPPLPFLPNLCKSFIKHDLYQRDPIVGAWHQGRAVLLGDAAHPIAPWMLDGPNVAIEEAHSLAQAIQSSASHSTDELNNAFQQHYDSRRSRAEGLQGVPWNQMVFSSDRFWRFPRNGYLRYVGATSALNYLSKKAGGSAVL